jgi:hypothetical protein
MAFWLCTGKCVDASFFEGHSIDFEKSIYHVINDCIICHVLFLWCTSIITDDEQVSWYVQPIVWPPGTCENSRKFLVELSKKIRNFFPFAIWVI